MNPRLFSQELERFEPRVIEQNNRTFLELCISNQRRECTRALLGIPDIHADDEALENSASLYPLTDEEILLFGDITGRGRELLKALHRIKSNGMKVIFGNHDLVTFGATMIAGPGSDARSRWVTRHGEPLIQEVLQSFRDRNEMPPQQIIVEIARLLFREDYAEIIGPENAECVRKYDNLLAVHSGLNDFWVDLFLKEGVDGMNAYFRNNLTRESIAQFAEDGEHGSILWAHRRERKENIISEKNATRLADNGIQFLARGHDGYHEPVIEELGGGLTGITFDTLIGKIGKRTTSEKAGGCALRANANGITLRYMPTKRRQE